MKLIWQIQLTLLLLFCLFAIQLGAVKPTAANIVVSNQLKEQKLKENRKRLTTKQKAGFYLRKKLAKKKVKQQVKKQVSSKKHKYAILSFVFGVVSIILFPTVFLITVPILALVGLGLLTLVFAIVAILWSKKALREIEQDTDRYAGKGLAKAGSILGLIVLYAYIAALIYGLVLLGILLVSFFGS